MKKVGRALRRITWLFILLLLVVVVVGVTLFVRTERFRVLLREQLVTTLNATLRGEVDLGQVEGSVWSNLTLHDLVVTYRDTEVLRAPRITLRYNLFPLLQGRLQITHLEGAAPTLRLIQDAQGTWNLLEALSSENAEEPTATETGGLDILLETLALANAQIDVTLAGQDVAPYRLAETNLLAQVAIASGGTEVQVRQLTTQLRVDPLPTVLVGATLTYQDTTTPATVHIANLTLDTHQSHLRVTGEVSDLRTLDTKADLVIDKLATAEIKQLVPNWPLTQDLSGTLQCRGPLSDVRTQFVFAATDAHITGGIRSNLMHEPLSYEGTITISGFDTQKMLQRQDVGGVIDGTVEVRGLGTAFAALEGKMDLAVRALEVSRWQLGNVAVSGSMAQQRGTINGKLESTLGYATWQGTVDLTETRPRYQMNLAMEHLNIKKVPTGMEPVISDLNVTGAISGKGFALSDIEAQADVSLRPSTIGPVAVERGRLAARLTEGRVQIAEFTLDAKDTTVAVRGKFGIAKEHAGQLSYAVHVGNVSPWLSLAGQRGTGALRLTGKAQGSPDDLQVQGELTATRLHVGELAVQEGAVTFQLDDIGQLQPSGMVTATLQNIEAGVTLKKAEAKVTLPQSRPPSAPALAQVAITVQDAAARTHRLRGEASYQAAQVTARLTELTVEAPDGLWTLAQPTQLVQDRTGVTIERFLMTNGAQHIQLDGRAGLSGPQDLHLLIDRFALDALQTIWLQRPKISGLLTVDAHMEGTAAAPRLTSKLEVTGLRVAGQDYVGLSAALGYAGQRATFDVTFRQDATHAMSVIGAVPLAVSWAEGGRTRALGDMNLQIRSAGLNLAFLNAFTDQTVNGVAGELSLDLALQGSVFRPQARGSFALNQGQARLTPLGVQISQVMVQAQVNPEEVRIVQLSAQAGDGRLTGSGVIALREYLPQQLTLSLAADRWPAIHTHRYHVELSGQISGQGPLSHPFVRGNLQVPTATLRPDLAFLTAQPVQRDSTIIVLPADRAVAVPSPSTAAATDNATGLSEPQIVKNLALDLTIRLPHNTWIKHQDGDVELTGAVHITKRAGGKAILVGTINVVRGWLNLQGRRFTLSQGQVIFTGGETINPTLDIIAQYRLPQYVVEAVVGGTIEKPTLTLRSDPTLEQADILALLLFGKPVNALGRTEKTNFQQQALQLTGGYIAAQIAESVSQALGLEDLGIDLRQVHLTSGRVGFGRYFGPNTYVSASQDLVGKTGHQVTVDHYLSPQWTITTSNSTDGDNTAGITWEKRY